jgi:uncharacterized repeat protein (TIGR03803 family)
MDAKGNLYGTTHVGGAYSNGSVQGNGTVFELTPPAKIGGSWTESILFNFNQTDGSFPQSGVIMSGGNLYGTTVFGGKDEGAGIVFKLKSPSRKGGKWTESKLFNFNGTDGGNPGALIMNKSGNLYGPTQSGGANGDGTVFELKPPSKSGGSWTHSILHSFDGTDGKVPLEGVIMDSGNIYGTAFHGGANGAPPGNGTVFELKPNGTGGWIEQPPYSFNGGTTDGQFPGGVILNDGNIFGTTGAGGTHGGDRAPDKSKAAYS